MSNAIEQRSPAQATAAAPKKRRKPAKPTRPYFRAIGLVEVWRHGHQVPECRLQVSETVMCYGHAQHLMLAEASAILKRLGVPDEARQDMTFELEINDWHALDAKHVIRRSHGPVKAMRHLDGAELRQAIRQRRAVPDDVAESTRWYVLTEGQPA